MAKHGGVARLASTAAALLLAVVVGGCGGEDISRRVDATVTLDLPDSTPVGSPLDIGYTWTPNEDFEPPADDYRVFVHLVDPEGNIVVQDDHFPPVPTSQWEAGEPVSYRHWVYPGADLSPDYFDFYVGLYDEEGQVGTLHEGRYQNRPLVHSVVVRTDDQGGVPVYVEGFEQRETSLTAGDPSLQGWQWMGERGLVAFGNPHGPATLHLRALSPVDYLEGRTQTVTISIGDQQVATFEATDSVPYLQRFEIAADVLPEGDWLDVTLEVDKTFIPAQVEEGSTDIRELGLQVFWMYLQR
jgi:hypothetical protein